MAKHRRAPRPAAGPVAQLLGRLEPRTPLSALQRAWPAAVGEHLAPHASPVSVRDGVAVVQCSSGMWAEEVGLLQGEVLERLAAELGPGAVRELRCRATPLRGGARGG
jgi:predicted nucleic acid-binding Zn ribbon protein